MRTPGHMIASSLFAAAGMAMLAPAALAQQPGQNAFPGAIEPAPQYSPTGQAASQSGASPGGGISLKLMDVLITAYPLVKLEVKHDDNIYSTPNNRIADQILVLTPALRLEAKQAGNTYSVRIGSTIGQYQHNTAENFTDYNLNGLADLDLGTRLRATLKGDYLDGEDPRGSTNNPLSAVPDRYRQTYGQGIVSYGARGARGRIDFELAQLRRNYYNNRATTAANDRAVDDIGATFYWRAGPKTTLLFQGKHSAVGYLLSSSTLGSVETSLLAGATWEASAKTTGTFRFGLVKKDFDDAARGSSTASTWTGEVRWSPRTYSHVNVNLVRAPAETTGGVGNFIDRTSTGARWVHDWSSRLTSEASAAYLTDTYQGVTRTDNTQNYGLKATYKMRRWLSFGGDYAHTIRNSDDSNFAFRRNVFMLFVNATL